jgi:hypothetical protein
MNKAREIGSHVDIAERVLMPTRDYIADPVMQGLYPNVIHHNGDRVVAATKPGTAVFLPKPTFGVVYGGWFVTPIPRCPQRNVLRDWDDEGADAWPQIDVAQIRKLGEAGTRVRVVLRDGIVPQVRPRDSVTNFPCYSDTPAAATMYPDGVPHEGNIMCVFSIPQ